MRSFDDGIGSMVTPSYAVNASPTIFLQHVVIDKSFVVGRMLHRLYPDLYIVFTLMAPPNTPLTLPINTSIQNTITCKKTQLTYIWTSRQLIFPVSISQLPLSAYFHIDIYVGNTILGYTEFPVYNEHFSLQCMMHTKLIKPIAYTDNQTTEYLPPIELSFELALSHSEDRQKTIASTICYAPEGLLRKTSVLSATTTADAHLVAAKNNAQVSIPEMNALLATSITADMDVILAHKVAEHYYRVSIKEALYLNKHRAQNPLNINMLNEEAMAVSNYAAITVQHYIPFIQFYDCEQLLMKFKGENEAGTFSRLSLALKAATEKPLSGVDIFGPKHPVSAYTNAETLSHLRNIIANSFSNYQSDSAPTAACSTCDNTNKPLFCTLTQDVLAATSINSIKLNQFNPTDYALALNYKISSKYKIRDQNEHILSAIAPQFDADPSTLIPDSASAAQLEKLCDVLFTHQLKAQDRDLIWKYRYYMRKYPRGLIKVISSIPQNYRTALVRKNPIPVQKSGQNNNPDTNLSVDNIDNQDLHYIVDELKTLLYTWNDPAIDQILLLLSREYSLYNLNTGVIREYAINKLNQFTDSVLLHFLLEIAFKIELDDSLCVVNDTNYKELYMSLEEHMNEYQDMVAEESMLRLEKIEHDLSTVTPIMEPVHFQSKDSKKKNIAQSKSILSGMTPSPADFFDHRKVSESSTDPKSSMSQSPAIGNIFTSSSKLSIKSFRPHSFSIEINTQTYGHSQVIPKSSLQKATIMEENASPFADGTFSNMMGMPLEIIDASYSDSSENAPAILLASADEHTTSEDTKHTTRDHSQTSVREEPVVGMDIATEPQRYLAFRNLSDMLIARAISAPYTFYLFYFYVDLWYNNACIKNDENAKEKLKACRDNYHEIMKIKDPEFYSCLRSTILFTNQLISISRKVTQMTSARLSDQKEAVQKMIKDGSYLTALQRKSATDKPCGDEEQSDVRIDADKPGIIFPFVMLKNHQSSTSDDGRMTALNLRQPTRHRRIESLNAASISSEFNMLTIGTESNNSATTTIAHSSPKTLYSDTVNNSHGGISMPQLPALPSHAEEEESKSLKDNAEKRPGNVLVIDKNETYKDSHDKFIHICDVSTDVKVMSSAKRPILYNLIQAETGRKIPVLLKINDDVRLDMLYVHLFSLMDNHMQTHNLDMKFTIYTSFAISPSVGFIECILPSEAQDTIIKNKEFGTITDYFNAMICKYRNQVSSSVLSHALVKLPSLLSEIATELLTSDLLYIGSLINESLMDGKALPQSPYAFSEISDKSIPYSSGKGSFPFGEDTYQMVKKKTRPSNLSSTNLHVPDISASMEDLVSGVKSTKGAHKSIFSDDGADKRQESSQHSRNPSVSDYSCGGSETVDHDKASTGVIPSSQIRHTKGVPSSLSIQLGSRSVTQDAVQKWLAEQLTTKGIDSLPKRVQDIINSVIDKTYKPSDKLDCMNGITAGAQMSNFIKSTAAYSVATYLLGVGDRHGENLLFRPDGKMFHIDFGWCFGKDPKPMAPKMKVSKDLVKAMGGEESEGFERYINYVAEIFCMLRKDVYIIISLLYMLKGGGMTHLDSAAESQFYVIEDKYQLSLEKDAAIYYILDVVKSSMKAITGQVIDVFHRLTQRFKK